MKKDLFGYFSAGALLCAAACSNDAETFDAPQLPSGDGKLRVEVAAPASRAEFYDEDGLSHLVRYTEGDEMLLWEVGAVNDRGYRYVKAFEPLSSKISDRALNAEFAYSLPAPLKAGDTYPGTSYRFDEVYYTGLLPASAFVGFGSGQSMLRDAGSGANIFLSIPRSQTPTDVSPDPAAVLLRACDARPSNGTVTTRFRHMTAYMKITIRGLESGERLTGVNISSSSGSGLADSYAYPSDNPMSVRCRYDLGQAEQEYYNGNGFSIVRGNTVVVDPSRLTRNGQGDYVVWVGCAPNQLSGSLGITVKTDLRPGNDYYKSVPLTRLGGDGAIALLAGRVAAFTLNFGQGDFLSTPELFVRENAFQLEGDHAGRSRLVFAWSMVLNSDRYVYEFDGVRGETSATSVEFFVEPGSEHTFAVKAADSTGRYAESEFAQIGAAAAPAICVLGKPEVTVDPADVTTDSFVVSWSPVEGASSYSCRLGDGPAVETAECRAEFRNLADGTEYAVGVRALSSDPGYTDASEWSVVVVRTAADGRQALEMGAVTAIPSASCVELSWSPVAGATGYLCKLGAEGPERQVTATECTFEGLQASTAYTACVMAVDASGSYKSSGWVTADFTTAAAGQPTMAWDGEVFRSWLGSVTHTEDLVYNDELFFRNGGGKGIKYASGAAQLQGAGSESKVNLYFRADRGPGSIRVTLRSSGTARKLAVSVDGVKAGEIDAPDKSSAQAVTALRCDGATAGSTIRIYSLSGNINIYRIEWIPEP